MGFVVADCGGLLFAIDRQLGGIHIHHGAPKKAHPLEKCSAQMVVTGLEIAEALSIEPPKKLSERVAVREIRKAQQVREEAVEFERFGVLHTTDPGDDGEQVSQKDIRRMELSIHVGGPADVGLEEPPKRDGFAELLKNEQAAIASYPAGIEGNSHFS